MALSFECAYWQIPNDLSVAQRQRLGSVLLAKLISHFLDEDQSDIDIFRNVFGQPECNRTNCYLSLSHSGDYLAGLVASSPCGIDIEKMKPNRDVAAIWQAIRHDKEPLLVTNISEFYQWWTRKEAVWKVFACQQPNAMKDLAVAVLDEEVFRKTHCINVAAPTGYAMSIAYS